MQYGGFDLFTIESSIALKVQMFKIDPAGSSCATQENLPFAFTLCSDKKIGSDSNTICRENAIPSTFKFGLIDSDLAVDSAVVKVYPATDSEIWPQLKMPTDTRSLKIESDSPIIWHGNRSRREIEVSLYDRTWKPHTSLGAKILSDKEIPLNGDAVCLQGDLVNSLDMRARERQYSIHPGT
jgi:hypothetical protein